MKTKHRTLKKHLDPLYDKAAMPIIFSPNVIVPSVNKDNTVKELQSLFAKMKESIKDKNLSEKKSAGFIQFLANNLKEINKNSNINDTYVDIPICKKIGYTTSTLNKKSFSLTERIQKEPNRLQTDNNAYEMINKSIGSAHIKAP